MNDFWSNMFRCLVIVLTLFSWNVSCVDCQSPRRGDPQCPDKPNIIVIVADDMGFNDASIHGSNQIPTPNIDALGIYGILLNRMYVAPMCTPSRSSFLTGKYESNLGMQHFVIASDQPFGLGLDEKLMPQYLREAGYATKIVGKWHLGMFERAYTPLYRGFDSHFGFLGPYIDYFNYSLKYQSKTYDSEIGYDLRKNLSVHWLYDRKYATDLLTDEAVNTIDNHDKTKPLFLYVTEAAPHAGNEFDPLQAPEDEIRKFNYIKHPHRRTYAAMVSKLDQSVGRIVKALHERDMLRNSIVLFFSDNGAPVIGQHANRGSNYPFKGQKDTPWEGAVRSAACIWSPLLQERARVSNQLIHVSDWLPTFAKIAGVSLDGKIDGKNIWSALSRNLPSPRKDVLCHYDQKTPYKSYISGKYKYVSGSTSNGQYDYWIHFQNETEENENFETNYAREIVESDVGRALAKYQEQLPEDQIDDIRRRAHITCKGKKPPSSHNASTACDPITSPCLFDLETDPCETTNLALELPGRLSQLQREVGYYGRIAKEPRNKDGDPKSNPKYHNGTWTWWKDDLTRNNGTSEMPM